MNKNPEPDRTLAHLPLDIRLKLEAAYVAFEKELRDGTSPTIESYLEKHHELPRQNLLLELLSLELPVQLSTSEKPDLNQLLLRFPNDVEIVRQAFELATSNDSHITGPLRYLGEYELVEVLGRGGMGVVYKAKQASLKRLVAVKMIITGQLATSDDIRRFKSEAEAAAKLKHPGIVPIYEVGRHEGHHFFSMEFVDGQCLASLAQTTPLTSERAARYVESIAHAIEYAHRQEVLHRDLKPANILIDQNDQPRVTDFGLAKRTDEDSGVTATGQILGTPGYMPPEQAKGLHDDIDVRSDVYSLGAILYALLIGRSPFQAETPAATIIQVINQEVVEPRKLNHTIDRDLETICLKCLEKDRHLRYQSAQELADELGRYMRGEPIYARPLNGIQRAWRWSKRKPLVAGLSVAVLLAMLLGTTISTYFGIQSSRNAVFFQQERDRALEAEKQIRLEVSRVRGVSDFLVNDLLAFASPKNETRRDATLAEILDIAAVRIDERFANNPHAKAAVHKVVWQTYEAMDRREESLEHAKKHYELSRSIWGPDHEETLVAQAKIAYFLTALSRGASEDWKLAEDAYSRARKIYGDTNELTLDILSSFIYLRINSFPAHVVNSKDKAQEFIAYGKQNIELAKKLLDARRASLGENHTKTAMASLYYGFALLSDFGSNDKTTGRALLEKSYELLLQQLGPNHPDTLLATLWYGDQLRHSQTKEETLSFYAHSSELCTESLGGNHWLTIRFMTNFASALESVGQTKESKAVLERLFSLQQLAKGRRQADLLKTQLRIALRDRKDGRTEQAKLQLEQLASRCLENSEDDLAMVAFRELTAIFGDEEDYPAAERNAREFLRLQETTSSEDDINSITILARLAYSLGYQDRFEDSADVCIDMIQRTEAMGAPGTPLSKWARTLVAQMFKQNAKRTAESEILSEVENALLHMSDELGVSHAVVRSSVAGFLDVVSIERGDRLFRKYRNLAEALGDDDLDSDLRTNRKKSLSTRIQQAAEQRDWDTVADLYYQQIQITENAELYRSSMSAYSYAFGIAEHRDGYKLLRNRLWEILESSPGHVFLSLTGRHAAASPIEDEDFIERARTVTQRRQYKHMPSKALLMYRCGDYEQAGKLFDHMDDTIDCRYAAAAIAAKLNESEKAKNYYDEAELMLEKASASATAEKPLFSKWTYIARLLIWRREAERAMNLPESPLRIAQDRFIIPSDR